MNPPKTIAGKSYIPALDGLRGLAIILVISFHYFGYLPLFSFGWCGVDLFFVLSGYLITSRLVALQNEKNPLLKFYANRALRILPLYFLTLIVFYIAINLMVKQENLYLFQFYNHQWLSFVLFFQNWSFIYANEIHENHLTHFWSLAVEEQFYLIWPIFLYGFSAYKYLLRTISVIIILIILVRSWLYIIYPNSLDSPHYFYNTFCRMDGFLIGASLLLFQKENKRSIQPAYFYLAFFSVISGIIFTGNARSSNPFMSTIGFTLVAVCFAGLLSASTKNQNKFPGIVLNFSWLKFVGRISYGLYIFHWLVLIIFNSKIENLLNGYKSYSTSIVHYLSLMICLFISFILSVLSYFYFESYFLQKKIY